MTGEDVKDKQGQPIQEGDNVWTRARGGKREGTVEKVVTSKSEADEEGVKNPPKVRFPHLFGSTKMLTKQVLFTDQHGHHVAHNPGTLKHGNGESK